MTTAIISELLSQRMFAGVIVVKTIVKKHLRRHQFFSEWKTKQTNRKNFLRILPPEEMIHTTFKAISRSDLNKRQRVYARQQIRCIFPQLIHDRVGVSHGPYHFNAV